MKTVSILHPFTPQAAGVVEANVPQYHSQPHVKAMIHLAQTESYDCRIEYFTPKWKKYSHNENEIQWNFYPVSYTLNGDHKKWKKQASKSCFNAYKKNTPNVTIINMSGHSSPFSYKLSKLILKQEKQYIAMLGGRHYSDNKWIRDYYKNAHHILVHTELQKQEMLSMNLFKDSDIRVFPLGIDTDFFSPQKKEDNQFTNLLYVGRISELKRVHLAIEVVAYLIKKGFDKVILKIIGPVYFESYQKELEKLVLEKKLENHVFFEGFKEHFELPYYFQKADLLLLPSQSESFGMVVVESMACGVPVAVIEGVTGPEEIITHNSDGIITSLETYITEIANLISDKEQLNQMKKNARQKVLDKYSIKETSRVLSESIKSAL